ncbi:MAG TPA: SpoIIE family protein phosphatase [Polyangiaceae bacterium]|nr:SpoIIE family protein phosphatase [Polyangiaceae bacterium]
MTQPKSRPRPRVGLFLVGGAYAYQADIISGAHDECARRGLDLVCLAGGSLGWADPRSYSYRLAAIRDLDAAILVPGTWGAPLESAPVRELLERFLALPSCIIGARHGDAPSVCIDNEGGVEHMTRHLIEAHGRTRIAFIGGRGVESEQRRRGFERALRAAGREPDPALMFDGDYRAEAGREAAEGWCRAGAPACDAIVAANDWMALGALEVLQARGVRVPEEVSLVGFDDIDRAKFNSPPLTTIRQLPHLLAVEAVGVIDGLLHDERAQRHVAVPTAPQIRRSCGCFGHVSGLRTSLAPVAAEGAVLADARARIAEVLADQGAALAAGLPPSWAEQLIDALLCDLDSVSEHAFLNCLSELISATAQHGNITSWHHVVARLREQSLPYLQRDRKLATRAEALFGRAYVAIGERAEFAQARLLVEREDLLLRLEDASREARAALDLPALWRVLTEHLRCFRIPRFHVVAGDGGADGESRLIYAFDRGAALELPKGGVPFRTSEIVPRAWRHGERSSLVTHALFIREEILGYCCQELESYNGSLLKTLGELISSSLKATQLSEALVAEVTRRERAERARMHQELEIAARIQTAILPREPSVPGLELATSMQPASEVGGDYFDILPAQDGCWIGIGDVAGHGLPAGVVMLMIQSIVAASVHDRPELQPGQAWRTLNSILSENIRQRMRQEEHATLCLIRYSSSGLLRFAGAHEDLIVYRKATGRVERVHTSGIWAGISPDVLEADLEEREARLQPGDVLLLHTDGVVEALSACGEMYGIERLMLALAAAGELPVQTICERIRREVGGWMQSQADDITLVVARHTGLG